jgi:hypothetical protein
MTTIPIIIQVDPQAARAFASVTPEMRRKLETLLSLRLLEATRTPESLSRVMSEISRNAQARGLTSDMLQDLLKGE